MHAALCMQQFVSLFKIDLKTFDIYIWAFKRVNERASEQMKKKIANIFLSMCTTQIRSFFGCHFFLSLFLFLLRFVFRLHKCTAHSQLLSHLIVIIKTRSAANTFQTKYIDQTDDLKSKKKTQIEKRLK